MVLVNGNVESLISPESLGFPLVIQASYNESIRIYEVSDVYELLSALSRVVSILSAKEQ